MNILIHFAALWSLLGYLTLVCTPWGYQPRPLMWFLYGPAVMALGTVGFVICRGLLYLEGVKSKVHFLLTGGQNRVV